MRCLASLCFVAGCVATVPALAEPRNADGLPSVVFSAADDYAAGTLNNGPLFDKAKAALLIARDGDGAKFAEQLTASADLTLRKSAEDVIPFSDPIIKAALESCLGPLPYDEGRDWVQFSLICKTDGEAPIARYLSFRDSAELNVSVWFEGEKIKKIVAMETIPIPGARIFGKGVVPQNWTRK